MKVQLGHYQAIEKLLKQVVDKGWNVQRLSLMDDCNEPLTIRITLTYSITQDKYGVL